MSEFEAALFQNEIAILTVSLKVYSMLKQSSPKQSSHKCLHRSCGTARAVDL
ncbi:MAG: hypothetical protein KDD61_05390 [Bdellovibrionales bacterium]|nr:hypothetical protein [Bdellovibrionales bacterium]